MGRCRIVAVLFRIVPVRRFGRALIEGHLTRCPACRSKTAGVEEARAATFAKKELDPVKDFWPAVSRRIAAEAAAARPARRTGRTSWRWAAGAAGLLVLAAVLLIFRPRPPLPASADPAVKVRIENARIYDKPAQAFIFKTQDPDRTFVWIEKM